MIDRVSFDGTTFNRLPFKFEAGTPNIAGAIGLGAAVRWVQGLDRGQLRSMSSSCCGAVMSWLSRCGSAAPRSRAEPGWCVQLLAGGHASGRSWYLARSAGHRHQDGHHCAQPLMSRFEVPGTARASFSLYNTLDEVEALFAGLAKIQELFS